MTSKNGSQELISLLQYMKRTDIQNSDITVKNERILELDDIVQEVKASEEWEAVKMSILEIGIEKGLSVAEIADMLEEEESVIVQIVEIINNNK